MNETQRVPRPFHLLSATAFSLGAAAFLLSWASHPPKLTAPLIALVVAALLAENFAFSLPKYSVSLAYPLTIAAIALGGPAAAGAVAALVSTNYAEIRARRPLSVILFNVGQLVFTSSVGAWTYLALGGRVLYVDGSGYVPWSPSEFPRVLIPMVAVAVICSAANLLLTASAVAILRGESFRTLSLAMYAFVPTQVALALVGFFVSQVLAISLLALPLFIAPLAVARQLYQRYEGLKRAFVDTVRSLVGALEAKDPYTRGHSERVSRYSAALGASLGMGAREIERLEYAALLHDLGKLAVPGSILIKPARLEEHEMALIREHPSRGCEMVSRIPPLRDLAEAVAQHHQWFDGGGYPERPPGSELSISARILAVADSFDAMTSTRAYRPALAREQAVAELIARAGSQFDPEVVRMFIDARVGLTVMPSADDLEVGMAAEIEPSGLGG